MTTPTLLTDFISYGLAANMPVTPNVPAGCSAFYYQTDTLTLKCWTGAAWVTVGGAASGPTIVQTATPVCGAAVQSVTFGMAPTNGNLLIALAASNSGRAANTGWTKADIQDSGGTDFGLLYWKIAGAGESTTQTPFASADIGAIVCYEINGGAPIAVSKGAPGSPLFKDASGTSASGTLNLLTTGGLVVGFFENTSNATDLPTAPSGVTLDSSHAVGSGRTMQGFTANSGLTGTTLAISATYAGSDSYKLNAWQIH